MQVSTAAVIALAEPVLEVDRARARARQLLLEAGLEVRQPSIVHCTLARYGASGQDVRALAHSANGLEFSAETTVQNLVMTKELVYPSLVSERLACLRLGTASHGDQTGDTDQM